LVLQLWIVTELPHAGEPVYCGPLAGHGSPDRQKQLELTAGSRVCAPSQLKS